ncbi:MAG: DUF2974 domain-containing protein [Clostridiales bacterium]|nr:DUF2974 domain-containing protein [Clostridiales bacterium]
MGNIFDYLTWRGDLTFTQDPPNAVDALIFSTLTYVYYGKKAERPPEDATTLRECAEEFFSLDDPEGRARSKKDTELLHCAAATARFGQTRLCLYQSRFLPEQETQFAAMTFLLDDGSMFVAYRGTDNSLVGWKEDFNMTFQQTIPAQRLAQEYIRTAALAHTAPMRVAGHSKGGNLAVFAAARCSPTVRRRILTVYNNDGPGFTKYMIGDPGYAAIVPRIRTYIPQSSVIGMLLEHEEPFIVIRSRSVGLMQHDPYSWEVEGPDFLPVQEVTESSQFLDATIKNWFSGMTNMERNQLVEVLYNLLTTGEVENATDIFQPKNIRAYVKTLTSDADMRHILSTEFQGLLEAAKKARASMTETKELPPSAS